MDLYKEASRILKLVDQHRGSIKTLTFSSNYKNKRQLYALVCETVKHSAVLQEVLNTSKVQQLEKQLKETHLAKALLYDFLYGKGLRGTDELQKAVKRHSAVIKLEAKKIKSKTQASDKDGSFKTSGLIPRYVRVNTLKTTVQAVIEHFTKDGFHFQPQNGLDRDCALDALRHLESQQFTVDLDVPQLLVFAPGKEFHEHPLYKSGQIILQDKASCLPAVALNPPEGSHVIDCCAAPGNKTTLLADMMKNKGRIFAFDKDSRRLSTMNLLTLRAGASCLTMFNEDFLKVNPHDPQYGEVEYILVDPSCSGSGIVSRRQEFGTETAASSARLQALSSFQAMILKHALSFPRAKRVVYSTCSIHKEENEQVVAEVIQQYGNIYDLSHVLPLLTCRGDSTVFSEAVKCVSMSPENSLTNGFFISCFERKSEEQICSLGGHQSDSVPKKNRKRKQNISVETFGAGSTNLSNNLSQDCGNVNKKRKCSDTDKRNKKDFFERNKAFLKMTELGEDVANISDIVGKCEKVDKDQLEQPRILNFGTVSKQSKSRRKNKKLKKHK